MRRRAAAFLLGLATCGPAGAQGTPSEEPLVAVVRGAIDDPEGALELVRSDGTGARTLIDDGVIGADVGPGGDVYAIRREGDSGGSLVRVGARDGDVEVLAAASDDRFHLAVAASPVGGLAVLRYVTRPLKVPAFLEPAVEPLTRTEVPPLVPRAPPPGREHLVTEAEPARYQVLFTNDPQRSMSHPERRDTFITGVRARERPPPDADPVEVRGSPGGFFCGAAACFLSWIEGGVTYTVGEFSSVEEASGFAKDLVAMEDLAGPFWRLGEGYSSPELVIMDPAGPERVLEQVEGFCECSFRPVDWSRDGARLLVILDVEGSSELREYDVATGTFTRAWDEEPHVADATYGRGGILALVAGEGGPPGDVRLAGSRDTVAGGVLSVDAAGDTLAFVDSRGKVVIRDLPSGSDRVVLEGGRTVALGWTTERASPAPSPAPARPASPGSPPWIPVAAAGVAGAAVIGIVAAGYRRKKSRRRGEEFDERRRT